MGFRFAPNLLAALPPKHNSTRPRIPQVRKLAISHPEIYIFYKKAVLRQNHSANHRFVAVLCPRTTVIFSCISSLHVPREHRRYEQKVVCLWIINRGGVQQEYTHPYGKNTERKIIKNKTNGISQYFGLQNQPSTGAKIKEKWRDYEIRQTWGLLRQQKIIVSNKKVRCYFTGESQDGGVFLII